MKAELLGRSNCIKIREKRGDEHHVIFEEIANIIQYDSYHGGK